MSITAAGKASHKTLGVLFCLFAAVPAARLIAQQPAEVSLNDDSDWWSLTNENGSGRDDKAQSGELNIQKRVLSGSNFSILGMDIRKGVLEQSSKKIGDATVTDRGDAGSSRGQKCYVSSNQKVKIYFIVEEGEVNDAFYLFSEQSPWNGIQYCSSSLAISRGVATLSGLKLGLTQEEVIHILGKPSVRSKDGIQYSIEYRRKSTLKELENARKEDSNLSEKEIQSEFGYIDVSVFIQIKFVRSRVEYIAISVAETT